MAASRAPYNPGLVRFVQHYNNFIHLPVIYGLFYNVTWAFYLLIAPLLLPVHLALMLYDFFAGSMFLDSLCEPEGRAVVITGCDSGFGKDCAEALASRGWKVYAGCLTDAGIRDLQQLGNALLMPVKLDITKQGDVDAAFDRVASENPQGLYCLVNNAGASPMGLVDWLPMKSFELCMDVNYFGMVRMCKAALPLLKRSAMEGRGARIVNVTSYFGLLSGYVMTSAYASSKHAADAFTRCLRAEIRPWGIHVATVNPALHQSVMANTAADNVRRLFESADSETQAQYADVADKAVEELEHNKPFLWEPINVRRMVLHAVAGRGPKPQYIVGLDALYLAQPARHLPVSIGDFILRCMAFNKVVDKTKTSLPANNGVAPHV